MKIVLYCRHTMGAGHFFRTLEIARALSGHDVILMWGGTSLDAAIPPRIRQIRLPEIMMDDNFKITIQPENGKSEYPIKKAMWKTIYRFFERENPDIFIIELYPFGRKAFRFEIDPVLKAIHHGAFPGCRVVCSLRDILVEKENTEAYEKRVLALLNRYFHALLVHSDASVIPLELTFSRTADIRAPVVYTGYVTPAPEKGAGIRLRRRLPVDPDEKLIVASAGGGKVGYELLEAVANAWRLISPAIRPRGYMFTGPFMEEENFDRLNQLAGNRLHVARFTTQFTDFLAAADLSVSLAGYNTVMNIIAARLPALVMPFDQNREQRLRCLKLAGMGLVSILEPQDLNPKRLAEKMEQMLEKKTGPQNSVNINGAANTAAWIEALSQRMENSNG